MSDGGPTNPEGYNAGHPFDGGDSGGNWIDISSIVTYYDSRSGAPDFPLSTYRELNNWKGVAHFSEAGSSNFPSSNLHMQMFIGTSSINEWSGK